MSVPTFQDIMLPLLQLTGDNQPHLLDEAIESLANSMKLSEVDRKELLPSGNQYRFDNRVGWARTYLKKAGLLTSLERGRFQITPRGLDVLKMNPTRIDRKFLQQFPEYLEFQKTSRLQENSEEETIQPNQTPEEILEISYQNLRHDLASDLIDRIKKCSPRFFERLVVQLLVAMGYGGSRKDAGQAIGQSGDGGVDGIIKEDKLGLDAVYVQAKRWEGTVGRPIIQAFAGSLEGQRARKGILITTSQFSQEARDYVTRIEKRIVLIDGEQLAQLMIDHGIGVNEVATYSVRKIDLDYFGEE
jgi:restriction system protein